MRHNWQLTSHHLPGRCNVGLKLKSPISKKYQVPNSACQICCTLAMDPNNSHLAIFNKEVGLSS